ncbi:MAG: hypothetical protein ACP5P1_06665 [Acidimicrobiales bacterium]
MGVSIGLVNQHLSRGRSALG